MEASLKEYIEKCQSTSDKFQNDWQTVFSSSTSLADLNETEVLDLFRLFELPVSNDLLVLYKHLLFYCFKKLCKIVVIH